MCGRGSPRIGTGSWQFAEGGMPASLRPLASATVELPIPAGPAIADEPQVDSPDGPKNADPVQRVEVRDGARRCE